MAEKIFATTFWRDFRIADAFGVSAIKDTYKRAFKEWKSDYRYLTDLVMVLNYSCWYWYDNGNQELSDIYSDLYYKTHDYALDHLKGDELRYYLETTD